MSDRLRQAVAALEHHRALRKGTEPDLFTQIETVAIHAGNEWKDRALDLVHYVALTSDTFTVCDLDEQLPPTIDRRAIGWVLRQGARLGWYHAVGYDNGGPSRHGRPVVLWASDLRTGDAA